MRRGGQPPPRPSSEIAAICRSVAEGQLAGCSVCWLGSHFVTLYVAVALLVLLPVVGGQKLDCWRAGYTADMCCQPSPAIHCWDAVFTYAACCPSPASAEGSAGASAPAAAAAAKQPPGASVDESEASATGASVDESEASAVAESVLPPPSAPPPEASAVGASGPPAAGQPPEASVAEVLAELAAPPSAPPPPPRSIAAGPAPRAPPAPVPSLRGGGGDASCWRDGFSFERCCEAAPIVAAIIGCWDSVFTERRCCRREAGGAGAAAAVGAGSIPAATVTADSALGATAVSPGEAATAPPAAAALAALAAADSGTARSAPPGGPAGGEAATLAGAAGAARAAGSAARSAAAVANALGGLAGDAVFETDASQDVFFRREGAKRWPAYFRKAQHLLDDALAADGPAASDPVQLYHLLYEIVNQVVGGVQLASQAVKGLGLGLEDVQLSGEAAEGTGGRHGTEDGEGMLRVAFLSAAVALARLAQASAGTPLEHEDFTSQAAAAVALSCRDNDAASFQADWATRLRWLRGSEVVASGAGGGSPGEGTDSAPSWRAALLRALLELQDTESAAAILERASRSWRMYAEDMPEALWRPAGASAAAVAGERRGAMSGTVLNPLDERVPPSSDGAGRIWQMFPTYIMTKPLAQVSEELRRPPGSSGGGGGAEEPPHGRGGTCGACPELSRIVLSKYFEFQAAMVDELGRRQADGAAASAAATEAAGERLWRPMRSDEVNNAFFAWQLTHESEQEEQGAERWPELYTESEGFKELRRLAKVSCLEYLQQVYDAQLSSTDLAQLELSIWASVTPPSDPQAEAPMGLAFHDHPLALLSGVFYVQAGGHQVSERTPTVFVDPRGLAAFRYTRGRSRRPRAAAGDERQEEARGEEDSMPEPTAPFHRKAYAYAKEGNAVIFPAWLVHGVPPHDGRSPRVVFAFNLHTLHGTTLSSWAKTTL